MSTLYARLLAAAVGLLTAFFGRWRRLTVLARLSDRLAPEARVTVNGTDITLFVPDRTAVYWPRHGFASEPGTLAWIDGFSAGDVLYDIGANYRKYYLKVWEAHVASSDLSVLNRDAGTGPATGRGNEICKK